MNEYAPSPVEWVRTQVDTIESRGRTTGTTIQGRPVVLMTMVGAKSGAIRKVPVMRVEHNGTYAAVASQGGRPKNPNWYHNLVAEPEIELLDGTTVMKVRAREVHGAERDEWWTRCVEAFPSYAEYQEKTTRVIPVFVLEQT